MYTGLIKYKRVDSHEIYYSACDLSSLEDQSKLTNSHYEEYHHRMIEESDESKSILYSKSRVLS